MWRLRYPKLNDCVGAWCPSRDAARGTVRLTDRSPYRNHGTLTNMTADAWVLSPGAGGGYALNFDGVNDFVTASDRACPFGNPAVTVACWVWLNNTSTSGGIFGYGDGANTLKCMGWYSNVRGAGIPSVEFAGNNPVYSSATIATGQWVHLCAAKRPGVIKDTTEIYYNGVSQAINASSSANTPNISTNSVMLGQFPNASAFAACKVDDARIYNRCLTPSEIALLYRLGRGGAYALEYVPIGKAGAAPPATTKRQLLLTGVGR